MKLRQKLSDGEQLRGNRGYACADNRPDNEPLNVHTYVPRQKNRSLVPDRKLLFFPISASGSNYNPRNTHCIPVVIIFAFLDLGKNS